jgi:nuclear transport factor 2 (NTF2) superfamily protein
MESRPPLPPFTLESARQKVQAAEDAWNTRDPVRVSLAYTPDTEWRNRADFVNGREQVIEFLSRKWVRELDYRLKKELWAFMDNRIAVRFEYEWHDDAGQWFRSHGNENWEFAENGLMQRRFASINDQPIKTASYVMTGALFVYMCMQPLFGALSDRIGRRNNMLLFGGLGALATVPILTALQHTTSPVMAFVLIIVALAIVSFYTSISGIVKAEMFPPEVRALGVGLAYAVANAIFGGSAEYVALGLKSLGHESAFFWYVSAMMVIAFVVSLRLPRQASYLHHDH